MSRIFVNVKGMNDKGCQYNIFERKGMEEVGDAPGIHQVAQIIESVYVKSRYKECVSKKQGACVSR